MNKQLGEKLLEEKVVTEKQLKEALERQRLHGGRLGYNLLSLGYITPDELHIFFSPRPEPVRSVEESGLELSFIADLVLKHVLHMGEFRLSDVVDCVKLPSTVIDPAIEVLRREKLVEVRGAAEFTKASYKFFITELGKVRAGELLDICRYVGPAPVPLESYKQMIELQTIKNIQVDEEVVRRAFSHLIISERLLRRLGPAISSGMPMFVYGPPGNGKTAIAETIGRILPDHVYMPYALIVGGQIITIFDPVTHFPVNGSNFAPDIDHRWIRVRRPVVITGGELTLKSLDLDFNPIAKFYEAPLQMKANNGLFIVDDFGRQQMNPQSLLNRWIVNLDRRIDFMALHTGMKFEIPFDQLVIFATNLEPKTLVDEAFLRRIRYKIKIDHPSEEEYEQIFRRVCEFNKIEFDPGIFDYLMKHYYKKLGIPFNACHPRDIIDHVIDDSRYYNHPPQLTREEIDTAWENYFVEK
jgi:predicted ATPase with chaperone activity